jgi:hypothetical protein
MLPETLSQGVRTTTFGKRIRFPSWWLRIFHCISYDDLLYNHDGQPSFIEALMTIALDRALI